MIIFIDNSWCTEFVFPDTKICSFFSCFSYEIMNVMQKATGINYSP